MYRDLSPRGPVTNQIWIMYRMKIPSFPAHARSNCSGDFTINLPGIQKRSKGEWKSKNDAYIAKKLEAIVGQQE